MSDSSPQWSWANLDAQNDYEARGSGSTNAEAYSAGSSGTEQPVPPGQQGDGARRRRGYKPRSCRICLEVVQPTVEVEESVTGLFSARTRVKYVSEEPELGRLISPCKCKGSQKYVHEGCLQAWRHSAPMESRHFWQCPTCRFQYRLNRLRWSHWLTSAITRVFLTILILIFSVFIMGFFADPIINFWLDPLGSISDTLSDVITDIEAMREVENDEPSTWSYHFLKGLFGVGVVGFLKSFLALSPWQWFNLRSSGVLGGRRGGTGRDRLENISWALVIIGVFTFMGVTWKALNLLTQKLLEKASDSVVDIHGDEQDDDEDDDVPADYRTRDSRKDL